MELIMTWGPTSTPKVWSMRRLRLGLEAERQQKEKEVE